MLIVGAIELGDGNIPGRLRLAEISSYGAADLGHFVETAADPDAIAKTDGWSGYAAVPADRHNVHVVGKTAAHLVLPWIHQVFSNLKGWARGVYPDFRNSARDSANLTVLRPGKWRISGLCLSRTACSADLPP